MDRKKIYYKEITEAMDKLEIGESLERKELITELWGDFDYYIETSFLVLLTKCKRKLVPKTFKTIKKRIIRTT
ncbi:MAG TPA: hypothetical protein VIV55_09925 [Flavobacterium sp.]